MITHRHRHPDSWLPRRLPWQQSVMVDRTHSLAPARVLIPQMQLADFVSGQPFVATTGAPAPQMTYYGPAFSVTGGAGYNVANGPFLGGLASWSIFAVMQTTTGSLGSGGTIYCERAASGNDLVKLHLSQSTSSTACAYQNDAGSLANPLGGGVSVTDGRVNTMAGVYDGVNVYSYYNGVVASTTSWPGANNNFTNGAIQQTIGYDVADGTGNYTGAIIAIYLYKRALLQADVIRLTNDPFGMLQPTATLVTGWTAPSSGSGAAQARVMVQA